MTVIAPVPQTQAVPGIFPGADKPSPSTKSVPAPDVSSITYKMDDGHVDPQVVDFVNRVISSGLGDAVIMSLLAQVLIIANANRQKERQLAIEQAFLALKLAESAAALQKEAAEQAFIGEVVSGSMAIVAGVIEVGANAIGLAKTIRHDAKVNADANRLFPKQTQAAEIEKNTLDSPNTENRPETTKLQPPPSYDELQEYNEKANLAVANSLEMNPHSSVDMADAPDVPRETPAGRNINRNNSLESNANVETDPNEMARTQYKLDRERSYATKMDARMRMATGLTALLTATGKISAATGHMKSGNLNAEATIEKALSEYMSARSHGSSEYASESGGIVQALIEAMHSQNANRHKAADTIWG